MLLEKEWEIFYVSGKKKTQKKNFTECIISLSLLPSQGSWSQNKTYLFKLESVGVPNKEKKIVARSKH